MTAKLGIKKDGKIDIVRDLTQEEYEEILTPEMIEERFRKLKEELSSKLKENEASIIEEEKD